MPQQKLENVFYDVDPIKELQDSRYKCSGDASSHTLAYPNRDISDVLSFFWLIISLSKAIDSAQLSAFHVDGEC